MTDALASTLVRSFIQTFSGSKNNDKSNEKNIYSVKDGRKSSNNVISTPALPTWDTPSPDTPSPPDGVSPVGTSTPRSDDLGTRPASMIFSRNPPLMPPAQDTPPELSPIFTYLNIHTNKVYHEGYFLKLNDQDNRRSNCDATGLMTRANCLRQMGDLPGTGSGWNAMRS